MFDPFTGTKKKGERNLTILRRFGLYYGCKSRLLDRFLCMKRKRTVFFSLFTTRSENLDNLNRNEYFCRVLDSRRREVRESKRMKRRNETERNLLARGNLCFNLISLLVRGNSINVDLSSTADY